MLFVLSVIVAARMMDLMIFGAVPGFVPPYFVAIVALALALSLPALFVRRLRDAGWSGRWALLALVPVAGWLAVGWLLARPTWAAR